MVEVDVFVGDLTFSLSDRQLEMVAQLVKIAATRAAAFSGSSDRSSAPDGPVVVPSRLHPLAPTQPPVPSSAPATGDTKASWLGWAMTVLGGGEGDEEDALESEIIAETKQALLVADAAAAATAEVKESGPFALVSCVRLCFRSVSLTLRKHAQEPRPPESASSSAVTEEQELVPVANIGMVRVPVKTTRSRVSRPATPLCTLRMSYVALEGIFVQGAEQQADFVVEIERVELVAAPGERSSSDASAPLFQWGVADDDAAIASCVSHPYFISSFFGDEARRLSRRDTRSFELVKVSFDTEIPVWRTLEATASAASTFNYDQPCECHVAWKGARVPCTPAAMLHRVSQAVTASIGLKERTLDGQALLVAVTAAAERHNVPIRPTDKLRVALAAIAREYQQLRTPDLGAVENLQQLLQPQVIALLGRETLHTCGAESLASSWSGNDVRRRSAHSAVRLRFSSSSRPDAVSSDAVDGNQSSTADSASKTVRVVDISLGPAEGALDPSRCSESIALVAAFVADVVETTTTSRRNTASNRPSESSALLARETPTTASSRSDSVVLITFSKLQLEASHDELGLARLGMAVRNVVYSASSDATTTRKAVAFGELSGRCSPSQDAQFAAASIQVVGLECTVNDELIDQNGALERRQSLSATIDRTTLSASDDSIVRACAAANGLLDAVAGVSFLRQDPHVKPVSRHARVFRLDVCDTHVSWSHAGGCDRHPLARRAFDAEVGSLSLSSSSSALLDLERRLCVDFRSGRHPLVGSGDEQPFVVASLRDQQTVGVACFVPLVPARLLFRRSDSVARVPTHAPTYDVRATIQLAAFDANLKGLLHAVSGVSNAARTVARSWKYQPRASKNDSPPHPVIQARTRRVFPAKWTLAVGLSAAGGLVHVNECVDLVVPIVSLSSSSPIEPSEFLRAVDAGGSATLVWSCGVVEVVMAPLASLSTKRQVVVRLDGVRGQVAYSHRVSATDEHAHTIDGEVAVGQVHAELSCLTVRRIPSFVCLYAVAVAVRLTTYLHSAPLHSSITC